MDKIAEVVEARTAQFLAQCYELHNAPPLGTLTKTRDGTVETYGIVASAETRGIDPSRRPIARGENEENDDAVFTANPQLARLLTTEFTCLVVGHCRDGRMHHYLPPRPARIHSFVRTCSPKETREFTSSLGFLDILAGASRDFAVDEVIAACLRGASEFHPNPTDFLVGAGKHLAPLLGQEYQRLNSILKRLTP